MKLLIALILVSLMASSYGLSEEVKKIAREARTKCMKETGLNKKVVDEAAKGKFPKDKKLAKFVHCFMTTTKMVNTDGSINEGILKKALGGKANKKTSKKLVDVCAPGKKKSKEDAAMAIAKCFYNNAKQPLIID